MIPLDLAAGADLDALGDKVGVPRAVMIPPRAGMTIAAAVAGVHQWAEAWAFATRHRPKPRPRRSRQVRGQRARCVVRVERRDAACPHPHTVGAVLAAEHRRDLTLYGQHVTPLSP